MRSIGLLTAIGALMLPRLAGAQTAQATQTAQASPYDPLAPSTIDGRPPPKKPPAYQKFDPQAAKPVTDQPTTFQPPAPAAGAGTSGFDSTNARKRVTSKPATKDAQPAPASSAIAPGAAAPLPLSPYQRPAPSVSASATPPPAATRAYAQAGAPGQPPVELGSRPPARKKKKREETADPYDPLGYRSGGLLYYPAIELIGGYDSNPSRTSNGSGSALATVAPELRVRSDWARHEFKADLRGSYNWYDPDGTPSLSRPYFNGIADGRIDVFDGSRIDLEGRVLVSTDNPNSPNLQAGLAHLPIFTTAGATAGVGQKFNRLDISLKGTVDRTVYQESQLTDGTTSSNDDRNYNQYGVILRTGYEVSPGITPFVQVGADSRVHDLETDFSGYQRDSTGWTALAGSTFELSRLLTGEVAIGYLRRDYQDPRLLPLKGPTGSASLLWTATPLTTVKLTGTSTVGESNVPGVSGIIYQDIGVQVDHTLQRWLIGTVKGGIGHDDYVGSDRIDHRYYVGAGLTYKLNRFAQIKGEARHEWLDSSAPINNYAANIFLLGLRLQY